VVSLGREGKRKDENSPTGKEKLTTKIAAKSGRRDKDVACAGRKEEGWSLKTSQSLHWYEEGRGDAKGNLVECAIPSNDAIYEECSGTTRGAHWAS